MTVEIWQMAVIGFTIGTVCTMFGYMIGSTYIGKHER